jgi:hypothetical protein
MKKLLLTMALLLVVGFSSQANAGVRVGIGFGGGYCARGYPSYYYAPGYYGYGYGPGYYGYYGGPRYYHHRHYYRRY